MQIHDFFTRTDVEIGDAVTLRNDAITDTVIILDIVTEYSAATQEAQMFFILTRDGRKLGRRFLRTEFTYNGI